MINVGGLTIFSILLRNTHRILSDFLYLCPVKLWFLAKIWRITAKTLQRKRFRGWNGERGVQMTTCQIRYEGTLYVSKS